MNYIDRSGNIHKGASKQDKFLHLIYTTKLGRIVIKPFLSPMISKFAGTILSTKASCILISPFVKSSGIDLSEYQEKKSYTSYNDFFTRKIRKELRPMDMRTHALISPSDGKVSAYEITEDSRFCIKHTWYTVKSLLKSNHLADKYKNGYAVIIRLCVDDYHRYCYVDDAIKSKNRFIPGKLHTVNPIANDYVPIFKENCREYTVLHTKHFGDILQMEVGALMVGKIVNYHGATSVTKGQEKGKFEFGGSTIILLLQKDQVDLCDDLLKNTSDGFETLIKMGEVIGYAR